MLRIVFVLRTVFVKILKRLSLSLNAVHPFLLTKPTEASKSQKNDSKFSTKTNALSM